MAVEDDARDERLWLTRLRWRLRGAVQWPTFAALTVTDAVVLDALPSSGSDGTPLVAGFLLSGFLNLGLIAVSGPLLGRAVRRMSPGLPIGVAADRAATALMASLFATFLVLRLLNHGDASAIDASRADALTAARTYDRAHAPARFQAGIGHESIVDEGTDLFRICVAGPDRRRNFCVFVNTTASPPRVKMDTEQTPNSDYAGPGTPSRRVGG